MKKKKIWYVIFAKRDNKNVFLGIADNTITKETILREAKESGFDVDLYGKNTEVLTTFENDYYYSVYTYDEANDKITRQENRSII